MAWSVMTDVPNPLSDTNGDPFSGAVLKVYLPGTTTSTSIAIDSSGSSPQTSVTANAEGKWEVSGNEILPYIDRKHKWGIFANTTDATANTPFYMGPFDNVDKVAGQPEVTLSFDTVAAMVASTSVSVGDIVETAGYASTGDGGDNRYEIVAAGTGTDDGGSFIDLATHQAKALFPFDLIKAKHFGVAGGVSDDVTNLNSATAFVDAKTNGGTLIVSDIDVTINSNMTIPADVTIEFKAGAMLSVATGVTVTWSGGLIAPLTKIFDLAGTGVVTFAKTGKVDKVHPEWWGAVADHRVLGDSSSTESGAALQACLTAAITGKKKAKLSNGGYKNDLTNIVVGDRITTEGDNREDSYIITTSLSSLTGTALLFDDVVSGDIDSEEWFCINWSYIVDASTLDYGVRFDSSYGATDKWMAKTTSTQAQALVSTNPTVNTNQVRFIETVVRSQSTPGGSKGLWVQRGANIGIYGGYYGDFDSPIVVGNGVENVVGIDIGGGILAEVFDTLNDEHAACIEIKGASAISITSRLQFANLNQRAIRVTGRCRGASFKCLSIDGTSVAEAAISFDGTASEQARGVEIGQCDFRVGSPSTNPVELINRSTAIVVTGITQANPAVVTTSTSHGFSNGDYVYLFDVVGMTEVNDIRYQAAGVTATTFQLQATDSTGFTAYTSGGEVAKMAIPDFTDTSNSFSATSNQPLVNNVLADGDTTPDVSAGNTFITNNSSATTITDLDGLSREQSKTVTIIMGDANTTIDFTGTSLNGNGGVDWAASAGDSMICTHANDQKWYCVISG